LTSAREGGNIGVAEGIVTAHPTLHHLCQFAKFMIVFQQGSPAQSLYLIESGKVRIFAERAGPLL